MICVWSYYYMPKKVEFLYIAFKSTRVSLWRESSRGGNEELTYDHVQRQLDSNLFPSQRQTVCGLFSSTRGIEGKECEQSGLNASSRALHLVLRSKTFFEGTHPPYTRLLVLRQNQSLSSIDADLENPVFCLRTKSQVSKNKVLVGSAPMCGPPAGRCLKLPTVKAEVGGWSKDFLLTNERGSSVFYGIEVRNGLATQGNKMRELLQLSSHGESRLCGIRLQHGGISGECGVGQGHNAAVEPFQSREGLHDACLSLQSEQRTHQPKHVFTRCSAGCSRRTS